MRTEEDGESGYVSSNSAASTPGSTYFIENDSRTEILLNPLYKPNHEIPYGDNCLKEIECTDHCETNWIESEDFTLGDTVFVGTKFEEEKRWFKECEDILLPYLPNKTYFVLVHFIERNDLECC